MRFLSRTLAAVLSLAVAAQPALAAQTQDALGASAHAAPAPMPALPALPSIAIGAQPLSPITGAPVLHGGTERLLQTSLSHALAASAPAAAAQKIQGVAAQAEKAVANLNRTSNDGASSSAERQFGALTGEKDTVGTFGAAEPPKIPTSQPAAFQSPQAQPPHAPQPPTRWWKVFPNDPVRRQSFWRYFTGYTLFSLVYEMYFVSFPFLIASMTRNSLRQHNDPILGNPAAVEALINRNRAEGRMFHWSGQGISYAAMPLFSGRGEQNPQPWLTRSMLIRAGFLAAVAAVALFATGHVPLAASVAFVSLAIGAASFFQGVSSTTETLGTNSLMGAASVSDADRTKANVLLNVVSGVVAILGPALAGRIALSVSTLFGQTDASSAVIYFIYAAGIAVSGLIYLGVKLFWHKPGDSAAPATGPPAKAPLRLGAALGEIWSSLRNGVKLIWQNKFLRYSVAVVLVNSLFSDPLSSSILPDYVATLTKSLPGIAALLKIPALGWLLHGLTSTSMGYFSFMIVSFNVGSIVATALLAPARKLLAKFGYRTEESVLKLLYILAAFEAPLFVLMMHAHSLPLVLAFYGTQALVAGFGAVVMQGLMQKILSGYGKGDMLAVVASESFITIIAAIASTVVYGFVLNSMAIPLVMTFAAAAMALQAGLRLAVPWLSFSKQQRSRQ